MAINLDDIVNSVTGGQDTSTSVKVASGTAASAKSGSGH